MNSLREITINNQTYSIKDAFARAVVANEYSSSASYNEGDYCLYNGELYKNISAYSGEWMSQAWQKTNVVNEISSEEGGGYEYIITPEEWEEVIAYRDKTL